MPSLRVYLCQYAQNGDALHENPAHLDKRHWELNIRQEQNAAGKSKGVAFYLVGGTGCLWAFRRRDDTWYSKTEAWCGSRLVGHIDSAKIDELEQLLATIPLPRGDEKWNSQHWAWDALKLMREKGYTVLIPRTLPILREEMKEEAYGRWNNFGTDSD